MNVGCPRTVAWGGIKGARRGGSGIYVPHWLFSVALCWKLHFWGIFIPHRFASSALFAALLASPSSFYNKYHILHATSELIAAEKLAFSSTAGRRLHIDLLMPNGRVDNFAKMSLKIWRKFYTEHFLSKLQIFPVTLSYCKERFTFFRGKTNFDHVTRCLWNKHIIIIILLVVNCPTDTSRDGQAFQTQ